MTTATLSLAKNRLTGVSQRGQIPREKGVRISLSGDLNSDAVTLCNSLSGVWKATARCRRCALKNLALFLPFGRHNGRPIAANAGKYFPFVEPVVIGDLRDFRQSTAT